MVKFIDFCEVWFLPESVARVAAIVRDRHCHTPQRDFGCVLWVQQTNQLPHVPKLIWASVEVHSAAVKHPLSTVSPDSNPTIVVLTIVSKDNFIPFCLPHPSFIALLAAETSVVLRQG
ncbi:hypothetical protein TNCV_2427171 [Trichonephila clavipes]|nr:hypothetical protein TNCV_2427171 [Trichonephila clavipes]